MGGSNSETPVEESTRDPYKALVTYRATPLESGIRPAELLMGRNICTRVPTLPMQLKPSWSYLEQFREKDASLKARQKNNFGRGHSTKSLSSLSWRTSLATRPVGWSNSPGKSWHSTVVHSGDPRWQAEEKRSSFTPSPGNTQNWSTGRQNSS